MLCSHYAMLYSHYVSILRFALTMLCFTLTMLRFTLTMLANYALLSLCYALLSLVLAYYALLSSATLYSHYASVVRVKHTKTCLVCHAHALPSLPRPPPQKHSIVRAQHSIVSVMHYFNVVGRSCSKDLLIGRLTILVLFLIINPAWGDGGIGTEVQILCMRVNVQL